MANPTRRVAMMFEKIGGPMRVECNQDGTARSYKLKARAGGRMAKGVHFDVKVLASSSTNARLSLDLLHGPEEGVLGLHSTPIVNADSGAVFPTVVQGQSDQSKMLSEYLGVVVKPSSSGASLHWLEIEIYQMRKPY
jgi:Tfp pilus tip-associated adhesin PilY1